MDKQKLKQDYENACNAYMRAFCEKHGFSIDGAFWVGDDVGGILNVGYMDFDMETIRTDIDDYEPNKLALNNLLWFLGKVTSNEVIVAKLKIMSDADRKRKKYLSRYDGNESLYDDEYSKAVSTIAKECLTYLQNKKE